MSHPSSASAPPCIHVTQDRELQPRRRDGLPRTSSQHRQIAATINALESPDRNMHRHAHKSSCDNTDPIEYRRVQTSKSANAQRLYNNVDRTTLSGSNPVTRGNAVAVPSSDPSRSLGVAVDASDGEEQHRRTSRTLSFVTAPRVHHHHHVPSRPTCDASSCLPRTPLDTSSFVVVRYTNLSVSPGGGDTRIDAASRTLHGIGYGPSGPQACGTGSTVVPDGTGLPALGNVGMNGISSSMQQTPGACFPLALSSTSGLVAHDRSCFSSRAASSAISSGIPRRSSLASSSYSDFEAPVHGVPSSVRSALAQGAQVSQLRTPTRERGDGSIDLDLIQRNREEQPLQQWRLQQLQKIHGFHLHESNHRSAQPNGRFTQPSARFTRERCNQQVAGEQRKEKLTGEQSNKRLRQYMQHLQSPAQNCPPPIEHSTECQPDNLEMVRRSTALPGMGLAMNAEGLVCPSDRPDSLHPTPTTRPTHAKHPISATPSSSENNGSVQRDFACQYPGCTKTFDRRYNLTVHSRRHTDEMPYPCKFAGCPQRFKWRSSQSHHMKTRHGSSSAARNWENRKAGSRQSGSRSGMDQAVNGGSKEAGDALASVVNEVARKESASVGVPEDGSIADMTQGREGGGGNMSMAFSPKKRAKVQRRNAEDLY